MFREENGRSEGIWTPDPMLPKHVRYQAALHSVRNDCVRFFSCACLKHELYYTGARAVCQPVFNTFLRVFRIFFRQAFKSFVIYALFVHFTYPYFLLFASYRFPFARFLPDFSPRPCFYTGWTHSRFLSICIKHDISAHASNFTRFSARKMASGNPFAFSSAIM